MLSPMFVAHNCPIDKHLAKDHIEARIRRGDSMRSIEIWLKKAKHAPLTDETIARHRNRCMEMDNPMVGSPIDIAKAVATRAQAGLDDGSLGVTTKDGLMAQQLLDRRAEKAEDRKFMFNLAQLLSGGGGMAPAALIEGRAIDITPDEEDESLYAPAELRAGS